MHFARVYKRLECVELKEKDRKQMYDMIKRRYNGWRKKITPLFKFCLKNCNLKIIVKKYLGKMK